jgi:hypothetical protein
MLVDACDEEAMFAEPIQGKQKYDQGSVPS